MEGGVDPDKPERGSSREEDRDDSPTLSRQSGTETPQNVDVAVEISQQVRLPRSDLEDFASRGRGRVSFASDHKSNGSTSNGAKCDDGDIEDAHEAPHNHAAAGCELNTTAQNFQPLPSSRRTCLGRLLRFMSKVASSGVDHGYRYEMLETQPDGLELRRARDPQTRRELKSLFPGLARGPLRGRIVDPGLGTQPIVGLELPNEAGTYSTEVDENGSIISAVVDNESEESTACEVLVPGLERDAKIVFQHSPGAEQLCAEFEAHRDEDIANEDYIAPAKLQRMTHANTFKASFMFQPAIPLGPIVTKVTRKGDIMMLGDYYMWETLEMLIRFTVMFTVYAFLVVAFLSLVYGEENVPEWVLFLTLAAKQRENLSFYVAFFFQFLCIYLCIFSLRRAQRLGRTQALQHLLPVSGFHFCIGQGGGRHARELAQALSHALAKTNLNVWSEEPFLKNALPRASQAHRAASQACFQIIMLSPSFLTSPSACIHLQVALQQPPRRSVILVDEDLEWGEDGGEDFEGRAERIEQVLRALGQHVVRNRRQLMQHIDAVMLHAAVGSVEEELLSRWWSSCPPQSVLYVQTPDKSPSVTLSRPDESIQVLGRRMHLNFSWRGRVRLSLPSGAVSTGSHVLEAHEELGPVEHPTRGAAGLESDDGIFERVGSGRGGGMAEVKEVWLEFSERLNVPLVGWFLLLSICTLGAFVVLGPYLIDTYNSYVAFAGTTSGVCRVTGKNKAYEGGGKAAVQVWGCLSVFQACCESCHRRDTCAAFTVSGNDCLIITDWGPDASPDQPPPKPTLQLDGARSGTPVPVEELAGVAAPYFSLLQILALFVLVNAPIVLWRFLDVRLTHSPALLPVLLASPELARLKASVCVLVGRSRGGAPGEGLLSPLASLLEASRMPVKTIAALPPAPAPRSFHILCLDSVATATAFLASPAWRHAGEAKLLVVVDSKTLRLVPELRDVESIMVRKEGFVEDLIIIFGQKLGRFLRRVMADEGVPPAAPAQIVSLDEL